jgi:phage head maturation protease
MALVRQFGAITKVEDQDDGTIKVWGIASSEARDGVGEVITAQAMKGALPDYSKFPALREMHEPSAAGKVLEAEVDEAGVTHICAHVVDPLAITKVRANVYAGFSIGGKVLKRDQTDRSIITALKLVEISLVDSPCNPDAVINMWKADMPQFNPTGDEVVAKAKTMADEAGSKRYKDFLFKAREALIADALASLGDDEEDDDTAKVDEPENADGAAVATEAEGTATEAGETDEAKLAADLPGADDAGAADPAAALTAAIEKANDVVEAAVVVADEPTGPFADMKKAAAALRLISVDDPIAKGLYSTSRIADIMDSFQWVAESICYETASENDGSPQPELARQAMTALGALLIASAQEEVAEAIAGMPEMEPLVILYGDGEPEIVLLAHDIVDLVKADADLMAKAGARNSKADAAMIQQAHDNMAKLGAACTKDNCAKVDGIDDEAEKASLAAENERLAKALTDAAPAVEELTKKFETKIEDLTKRLEQVESEPAAPKTASGPLRAVTKGEDISPNSGGGTTQISADELKKVLDSLPEAERGQILLRAALSQPQLVQSARAAA